MITVSTLFWTPNEKSFKFSQQYNESWVVKLYKGFERNLTVPFQFVLFTDRDRELPSQIIQKRIYSPKPGYTDCLQPYEMNVPMILCGLDTVVTGNCDRLAEYCLTQEKLALPRDPYNATQACNGVALVPRGHGIVWDTSDGENDMVQVRKFSHDYIDDLFPGAVASYKGTVKKSGLRDTRIVYFHGKEKPHEIAEPWLKKHWTLN